MSNIRISLSGYISACLFAASIFILTPYLSRNVLRPLYAVFILLAISLVFYFLNNVHAKRGLLPRYAFILMIWVLYTLLYHVIGVSTVSYGIEFGAYEFYYLALIFAAFDDACNIKGRKALLYGIWAILIINILSNIYELWKNSVASTIIMIKGNEYLGTNVGSVSFISTVYLFALIILWVALYSKSRRTRIIAIISYALAFYLLIFLYNRASTSLLLIGLSLAMLLYKMQERMISKQRLILSVAGIIIGVPLSFVLLRTIAAWFGITRLTDRLDWILRLLNRNLQIGIVGDNSLSTRMFLIMGTLNNWVSSPVTFLFGRGDNLRSTNSIAEMFKLTGVGYHSDLVDVLGTHGIVGALLFWGLLRRIYQFIKKRTLDNNLPGLRIIYLGFILCLFFNRTLGGGLGIVLFYMLPSLTLISEPTSDSSAYNSADCPAQ